MKKRYPSYLLSDKILVKEFITKWSNSLTEELSWIKCKDKNLTSMTAKNLEMPKKFIESIERKLNVDSFLEKTLLKDINLLRIGQFDETDSSERNNPDNEDFDVFKHSRKYKHEPINRTITLEQSHLTNCNHNKPLALLTIQLFKPAIKYEKSFKLYFDKEFQVLSCQPLTVIRDSYFCPSDIITKPDYSDDPFKPLPSTNHHEKTGFFLIEQTFYHDDRQPTESLETLVHWVQSKMGNCCTKQPMSTSRFEDLEIRLGYPYLYMHRGNCEHLMVFTDIRMFIQKIEPDQADCYPKSTLMPKISSIKCQMCQLYFAKWITFHNKRLPLSPFYFCHNCFISFNYDEKSKQKIGSFKAFPIILDSLG